MDLRDRFAAHFAAALVDAFTDADQIARRAYDLAEAMLGERARRVDAGEGSFHGALLDAPEPLIEPLSRESFFWPWDLSLGMVRWMCSWDTDAADVDRFVAALTRLHTVHI